MYSTYSVFIIFWPDKAHITFTWKILLNSYCPNAEDTAEKKVDLGNKLGQLIHSAGPTGHDVDSGYTLY